MSSNNVLSSFVVSKPLPPNLAIVGADSHLYAIGLSLFETRSNVKRSRLRHPLIILICLVLHFIRINVLMLSTQPAVEFHLYLGDPDFFIGSGSSLRMTCFYITILCVSCQAIHYYNFKHRIQSKDLVVMEMLAGLVPPLHIGIHSKEQVAVLLKRARISLSLVKLVNTGIGFSTLVLGVIIYSLRATWLQVILIGIPQAITWAIWVHLVYCILNYHTLYFYLITSYLNTKLKSINSVVLFPWPRAKNVPDHLKEVTQSIH